MAHSRGRLQRTCSRRFDLTQISGWRAGAGVFLAPRGRAERVDETYGSLISSSVLRGELGLMTIGSKIRRRQLLQAVGISTVGATIGSMTRPGMAADTKPVRPKFRVLSLDGGGARGYLTIKILVNIEQYLDTITGIKTPLGQRFDFIAGTSTGGIIALALASGRSAAEVLAFYEQLIPKVFSPSEQRAWAVRLNSPKYDSGIIHSILEKVFGNSTLQDVKTHVCVTSVALTSGQPRFYKSYYQEVNAQRLDERLCDIALATAAAPTYFKSHNHLKHSEHLIDGGLCANNPSVVALIDALGFEKVSNRGTPAPADMSDLVLLSVGTGEQSTMPYDTASLASGGLVQWAQYISDVMFESQSWLVHYQALVLLGESYLRINPALNFSMALDDISKLNYLKNLADIGGRETSFIKKHFSL